MIPFKSYLGLDQYGSDSDSSDDDGDEGKPVKIETPKLDLKVINFILNLFLNSPMTINLITRLINGGTN